MPTQNEEFAGLARRVREGSEEATHELVEKYGRHVWRVVRRRLNQAMRSNFDSGDFVQNVWASFFENRERLLAFPSAKEMVDYLQKMARHKVIDEIRRRLVLQGRNVNREVRLDREDVMNSLVSPGPTPSEVLIADETKQVLAAERPDQFKKIIEMRQAGMTQVEIATRLGVSRRAIQRILRRLERRIEQ